jgi:hypothetical protein
MHHISFVLMLVAVFLFVSGSWSNLFNIYHKTNVQIHPWLDGLLAAYIVAYFTLS